MDLETFTSLSTKEIAQIVHERGPRVVVFPINGTRRWFMLEHPPRPGEDPIAAYLDISGRRHIELYRLFFDHGIHTLLTPIFGPDLMERGDDYMQMAAEGLARTATHPDFIDFYRANGVRVRFYGDYARYLVPTPYAHLVERFDDVMSQTAAHSKCRLFFGLFAHDATETIAKLAVHHHAQHGRLPTKREIVEAYYGEYVAPANIFIGFDKPAAFDMPLIATGSEDLYFTVSPSPYLNQRQLRGILYDHL